MSYKKRPEKIKIRYDVKLNPVNDVNTYVLRSIFFNETKEYISQWHEDFRGHLEIDQLFIIVNYRDRIEDFENDFPDCSVTLHYKDDIYSIKTVTDFYFKNELNLTTYKTKYQKKRLKIFSQLGA